MTVTEVARSLDRDDTTGEAPEGTGGAPEPAPVVLIEEELLVEEISIDGMCGVY